MECDLPETDQIEPPFSDASGIEREFVARTDEKLQLCAAMEEIADALPANVDRVACLNVANTLVPMIRSIHDYEERVVFRLFQAALPNAEAAESIQRLRAEHVEDECSADEITEVLMGIGHGRKIENPEALGYMLRAFFDTTRRHIAFEREHILPVIRPPG